MRMVMTMKINVGYFSVVLCDKSVNPTSTFFLKKASVLFVNFLTTSNVFVACNFNWMCTYEIRYSKTINSNFGCFSVSAWVHHRPSPALHQQLLPFHPSCTLNGEISRENVGLETAEYKFYVLSELNHAMGYDTGLCQLFFVGWVGVSNFVTFLIRSVVSKKFGSLALWHWPVQTSAILLRRQMCHNSSSINAP